LMALGTAFDSGHRSREETGMTLALQLLVFVVTVAGLIAFGFYRDKKEHASRQPDSRHSSIYFPDQQEEEPPHRGAAMSRLG